MSALNCEISYDDFKNHVFGSKFQNTIYALGVALYWSMPKIRRFLWYSAMIHVSCKALYYGFKILLRSPYGNELYSRYLTFLKGRTKQPKLKSEKIRNIFNNYPRITTTSYNMKHSHPYSATMRNLGSNIIDSISALLGMEPYYLQRSRADERQGRAGCRSYYWTKDLNVEFKPMSIPLASVISLVDVDMYMDMPKLLSENMNPVMLTTFQPNNVCKSSGDYSYTFNDKSEVVYDLSGGAHFEHPVWNYGCDTVSATSWYWSKLSYVTTTYNVDKKHMDEDHDLLLLTPMSSIRSPIFNVVSWLSSSELQRLDVVDNGYLRMRTNGIEGLRVSTGKVMKYASAKLPIHVDDTISSLVSINKTDVSPALIKQATGIDDVTVATILTEYHRKKHVGFAQIVNKPVLVTNYQHVNGGNYEEDKPSMLPFMNPIIEGAFVPTKGLSNDTAAVKGRVEALKNEIEVNAHHLKMIKEFSTLLVPVPHKLIPVDLDYVYEKQDRPMQRAILDQASMSTAISSDKPLSTFMKAESYDEPKDPRIITTYPGITKMNYSRYVYALTDVVNECDWYAFGKTPKNIANKIAALCSKADMVVNTDLSRFDGRVNNVMRLLESTIMMRAFGEKYHSELIELMDAQHNKTAITVNGYRYLTGWSRGSGSPETAIFNTIINAFMAYVTKRQTTLNPSEAWNALGIYGGDDGLTPDIDPKAYANVCKKLGQKLEPDVVKRGAMGVNFLARIYSDQVWYGCMDSMCDLKRQLLKLHLSVGLLNVAPLDKLGEKLFAYSLTDANTPIFFELIIVFMDKFPQHFPVSVTHKELVSWFSKYDYADQFPNENVNGWMEDVLFRQIPLFDIDEFHCWLEDVTHGKADILKCPKLTNCLIDEIKYSNILFNGNVNLVGNEDVSEHKNGSPGKGGTTNNNKPSDQPRQNTITTSKPNDKQISGKGDRSRPRISSQSKCANTDQRNTTKKPNQLQSGIDKPRGDGDSSGGKGAKKNWRRVDRRIESRCSQCLSHSDNCKCVKDEQ